MFNFFGYTLAKTSFFDKMAVSLGVSQFQIGELASRLDLLEEAYKIAVKNESVLPKEDRDTLALISFNIRKREEELDNLIKRISK